MEVFQLMQILDALPMQWRNSLLSCGPKSEKKKPFVLSDHIQLRLKNECVRIDKAVSKNVYKEIRTSLKALQLRKRDLRIITQIYAWIGTKYTNCHLEFS